MYGGTELDPKVTPRRMKEARQSDKRTTIKQPNNN